jgi:hypothetical protein
MATQAQSTNGVYLVSADGSVRIPMKRSVLTAIKRMMDGKESGSVILHFKNGANAGVEDRSVYQE